MNDYLHSIKHSFDIALDHLDLFYPLINSMYLASLDNVQGELFEESIKNVNTGLRYYRMGNVSIEKTISDAILYIDHETLERFYLFSKDAYKKKYEHLCLLINSVKNRVPLEINQLKMIYFQNFSIGLYCFPSNYYDNENGDFCLDLIEGIKEYFKDFESKIDEISTFLKWTSSQNRNKPDSKKSFSALQWATIFYYADETKLTANSEMIKTRMESFMSKHKVDTTFNNFKSKYYAAKKRINDMNDYPIKMLKSIIPFLKENYNQTICKVENDILFLEENKIE